MSDKLQFVDELEQEILLKKSDKLKFVGRPTYSAPQKHSHRNLRG